MFEFTEMITIEAPPEAVWEFMRDIDRWWPASNPEHDSLVRVDGSGELGVGTRLLIREKIAGIPGEALGTITRWEPGRVVTWDAPQARYRWFGVEQVLGEGVTWRIQQSGAGSVVSATVWARFPPGLRGGVFETVFRLVGGIAKDREHTRVELRYLKAGIEAGDS